MSMRCEINGCVFDAGSPCMVRQQDDWTTVAISLCPDHRKAVDSRALLIDRRTATGRFDVIPGPSEGLVARSR